MENSLNTEDKNTLSRLFCLATAYCSSGFLHETPDQKGQQPESSLPLAYLTDEQEPVPVMVISTGLNPEEEQLLDRMLGSIGLSAKRNCLLVSTAGNITEADESIRLHKPAVIFCLGKNIAGQISAGISGDIPVLATFHPGELLKNETLKRRAFDDIKSLMAELAAREPDYAAENRELLAKYAAADPDFAAKVQEYLV